MGKVARGLKKVVKPFVNFPAWMGWQRIRTVAGDVKVMLKDCFVPQQSERKESLEEAMQRLGLTEADIANKTKEFKLQALLYGVFCVVTQAYFIYLLMQENAWRGLIICGGIFILVLSLFFRAHFWLYQLKVRQLGCSLREWFHKGLLGKK